MNKKIFLLIFLLSACATTEEKARNKLNVAWQNYFEKDFDQTRPVEVFVATNRKSKTESFTCDDTQFGINLNRSTSFGICKINVPKNHVVGDISITESESINIAQNLFKILGAKSSQEKDFISEIKKSERMPLVFVHGFNVRYQEAVLRAAQIAYDLKYQGPVVLFTWPAGAPDGFVKDKMLNETYANNAATARASVDSFANFLSLLAKNDVKINLLVHSMGHQVALPAIKKIIEENPQKVVNELILNAPDFDVSDFRAISPSLVKIANRTTLYCSQNDKAMLASKTFNKSSDRLGACAYIKEVDVIDVGLTDDRSIGLGHGYYSSRAVLGDVFQALVGIEVGKRSFIAKSDPHSSSKYFLRK